MTYTEALTQIPEGAEWSSSFGNPGDLWERWNLSV